MAQLHAFSSLDWVHNTLKTFEVYYFSLKKKNKPEESESLLHKSNFRREKLMQILLSLFQKQHQNSQQQDKLLTHLINTQLFKSQLVQLNIFSIYQ